MARFAHPALLLALMLSSACGPDPALTELQESNSELQRTVHSLQAKLATLSDEVNELQIDNMMRSLEGVAFLSVGSDGYSTIETNLGRLTVSLENVRPYANGSKVTLVFGNTTYTTIDGVNAQLAYGSVDDKGSPLLGSERSKELAFDVIRPGSWKRVPVSLEGVPPAKLGYVRLSKLEHRGIRLLVEK